MGTKDTEPLDAKDPATGVLLDIYELAGEADAALQDSWPRLEGLVNDDITRDLDDALKQIEAIRRIVIVAVGGSYRLAELRNSRGTDDVQKQDEAPASVPKDYAKDVDAVVGWFDSLPKDAQERAQESLDELVHDLFSAEASGVNNQGFEAQVVFVFEQCGKEARSALQGCVPRLAGLWRNGSSSS